MNLKNNIIQASLSNPEWLRILKPELQKNYIKKLNIFLQTEIQNKKAIQPDPKDYLAALNYTPFKQVQVILLGQDPYHNAEQACGLSFSVSANQKIPPSLKNIYKELYQDLNIPIASHGCLKAWAKQGVLLLNSSLSVQRHQAGSHKDQGWQEFSQHIIKILNDKKQNLVFLLWGRLAANKARYIDTSKHCILQTSHPSPLSAYRGFFGSKPFSKTNIFLKSKGLKVIDWSAHLKLN